jgi:hypothetical protein
MRARVNPGYFHVAPERVKKRLVFVGGKIYEAKVTQD